MGVFRAHCWAEAGPGQTALFIAVRLSGRGAGRSNLCSCDIIKGHGQKTQSLTLYSFRDHNLLPAYVFSIYIRILSLPH